MEWQIPGTGWTLHLLPSCLHGLGANEPLAAPFPWTNSTPCCPSGLVLRAQEIRVQEEMMLEACAAMTLSRREASAVEDRIKENVESGGVQLFATVSGWSGHGNAGLDRRGALAQAWNPPRVITSRRIHCGQELHVGCCKGSLIFDVSYSALNSVVLCLMQWVRPEPCPSLGCSGRVTSLSPQGALNVRTLVCAVREVLSSEMQKPTASPVSKLALRSRGHNTGRQDR